MKPMIHTDTNTILAERHGRYEEILRLLEVGQITIEYARQRRLEIKKELPLPWDEEDES